MEYVEGLAKSEPEPSMSASQPQLGLAARHDDDDPLDTGLEIHALSEDEQESLSSATEAGGEVAFSSTGSETVAVCSKRSCSASPHGIRLWCLRLLVVPYLSPLSLQM